MIITFSNHKGGVGKTTLSVNLAHFLALKGSQVLFIDLDPQNNSSDIFFHEDPDKKLSDFLEQKCNFDEIIYQTRLKNVFSVCNGITIDKSILTQQFNSYIYDKNSKAIFLDPDVKKFITDNFDYCFIDTPPDLGVFTINGLFLADMVVIPVNVESKKSKDGINTILNLIDDLGVYGEKKIKVLLNNHDNRKFVSKEIKEEIINTACIDQFNTFLATNTLFSKAEYFSKTIFEIKSSGDFNLNRVGIEIKKIKNMDLKNE